VAFLRVVHHHVGGGLIVVLDRFTAHRSAAGRLTTQSPTAFEFEWLPAYSPELNPVEYVWKHTKCDDLANFVPYNVDELEAHASASLTTTRSEPRILRGCLDHAGLPL